MLGWLKKEPEADHALADPKAARALLAALPAQNPSVALETLSTHLDSLREATGLKAQRQFEIVDEIDAAAKPFQRKLTQDYLHFAGLSPAQETRISHVVTTFWLRLATAYRLLLELHEAGDPSATAIRAQLGPIAARAIRAFNLHLKWRLYRYATAEPRQWQDLGRIYAIAEARAVTGKCVVYPGTWGESTVERELLKVLMLSISSTDSLARAQVEIVERVCAQFSEFFVIRRQPATGCHFFFDLDGEQAPARLADRVALEPPLRFFGPGQAAARIEQLAAEIRAAGAVPSTVNLGGDYPPSDVLAALAHLSRYWAPQPPARKEARKASEERIEVVHGLPDVVAAVSGVLSELDFDDLRAETWGVQNESAGGFGAIVPPGGGDWLSIGELLGVKYADGAAWGVGIARRLSEGPRGTRYVGIEMFTRGVSRVRLLPLLADGTPHPDPEAGDDALLLPSDVENSLGRMEVRLVLRLGTFSPQKSLGMQMFSTDYLLVPLKMLEAGTDFDIASYRVLQRSDG
ncbi:MAG: hypothetical protein MUF30_11785 [Burkholderiales bacterium]|nr:hypothetical protein [Burkholderiales bacterium]